MKFFFEFLVAFTETIVAILLLAGFGYSIWFSIADKSVYYMLVALAFLGLLTLIELATAGSSIHGRLVKLERLLEKHPTLNDTEKVRTATPAVVAAIQHIETPQISIEAIRRAVKTTPPSRVVESVAETTTPKTPKMSWLSRRPRPQSVSAVIETSADNNGHHDLDPEWKKLLNKVGVNVPQKSDDEAETKTTTEPKDAPMLSPEPSRAEVKQVKRAQNIEPEKRTPPPDFGPPTLPENVAKVTAAEEIEKMDKVAVTEKPADSTKPVGKTCPKCGEPDMTPYGKKDGRQRWYCPACKKTSLEPKRPTEETA